MAARSENANVTGWWVCEQMINYHRSKGIFFHENPFSYTVPVLFMQTSLASILIATLQFLLAPLGQTSFVPQVLGGMMLGPSIIGQSELLNKWLFPPKTFYICKTMAYFGCMMFNFLIGVRIDVTILTRLGKKAWAIGIVSLLIPLIMSSIILILLRLVLTLDQTSLKSLFAIVFVFSTGSVHTTAVHLADLKLLNTEIGDIALSASMVNGIICLSFITAMNTQKHSSFKKDKSYNWIAVSFVVMVVFITCVLRPIMLWMVRKTPEGKPIKESYIMSVFLMLLGCAFVSELIGEHYLVGTVIFGMAVPDGPPLGSALTDRLDTMVSVFYLPLYFLYDANKFKLFLIDARSFLIVQAIAIIATLGKIAGTMMLPSIFWKMPVSDVLSLGLLMSANGLTQFIYLQTAVDHETVNEKYYANALITLIWLTGATTPIVKFLYDPSKKYLSLNRRRTIEQSTSDSELCLMACIHSQENTPSIINLLEMSNPSLENPICFYVLHLIQLRGRSTPLFIDHQPTCNRENPPHSASYSQHIINAFRSYAQQNSNNVFVKLFTSISPYETMHDEICMQVSEKRVCLLIVPFHRQWIPNEISESAAPIRALNRHLLRKVPCSIGILIERGTLSRNNPLTSVSFFSVGIIFIEGADDREALAYAMRMAHHPNVRVTLIRIMEPRKKNRNLTNRDPDGDLIHKFKVDCIKIKRHDYKEEIARDSVEMVNVIRSLEGCFDLILVGRRPTSESNLFSGLSEWNEYPELGPIGDMLVASDSTFDGSVLVIQQQKKSGVGYQDLNLDCGIVKTKQEPVTIVEVPNDRKVRPII